MTENLYPCSVRKIQKSDVPCVLQMMQRLAEQHHEVSLAQPCDILKHAFGPFNISHIWVAQHDNELVGFLEANYAVNFPEQKTIAHINLIYVRDGYREHGIALLLLQDAIADSMKDGCNQLLIEAYSTNERANRFYRNIGFQTRKSSFISLSRYIAENDTMKHILKLQRKLT
ncbi:MAG: GNAT family N-acetyltransferase [Alphaproteobacteria bacterium]|nr:GNAT family N-acetyltransferase [Alphaproteobacteria bacterium]